MVTPVKWIPPNQLLFDDALVEDKRGFTLTLKAPAKADVPALLPERPWEAKGIHGVCVVEGEGGRQLMYYGATGKEGKGSLCLAISSDGIV